MLTALLFLRCDHVGRIFHALRLFKTLTRCGLRLFGFERGASSIRALRL
jgi:hypothetical protein